MWPHSSCFCVGQFPEIATASARKQLSILSTFKTQILTDIIFLPSGQHNAGHDKNYSSQWKEESFKTKDTVPYKSKFLAFLH